MSGRVEQKAGPRRAELGAEQARGTARLRHLHAFLALVALVSAACGTPTGGDARPSAASTGEAIDIGEVGTLPPRSEATGARLVLPSADSLRIPGSFPLGSTVKFTIPLRNDGDRALVIEKAEPL